MWTGPEIAFLRRNAALGATAIASELRRSVGSVEQQAHRLRISLRRPGSRKGAVLGQARGVSLRAGYRDDVLAGRIDPAVIERRIRVDAEAELCPSCASRPIRVAQTGLCRACHDRRLADAHREALSEREARRDLWQARQAAKRSRDLELAETTGVGY